MVNIPTPMITKNARNNPGRETPDEDCEDDRFSELGAERVLRFLLAISCPLYPLQLSLNKAAG
jgi:hypothetical protein